MKDASTLPAGVTIDSRGFFSIPQAVKKFDPLVKFFCILEGADYQQDGSLQQSQVRANCLSSQAAARWPIPVVAGRTTGVVPNYGVPGFHFAGIYPFEPQLYFPDVFTVNPDVAATVADFIALEETRSDYVPPHNINPASWT